MFQRKILTDEKKVSWEEFYQLTMRLIEQINKAEFYPDYIVGIIRGGLIPASLLTYFFPKSFLISLSVIKQDKKRRVDEGRLRRLDFSDKKVLVVEDFLETGRSAKAAKEFLEQKGALVRIVCYYSSSSSEIVPDFVIKEKVTDKIIFPWEY